MMRNNKCFKSQEYKPKIMNTGSGFFKLQKTADTIARHGAFNALGSLVNQIF